VYRFLLSPRWIALGLLMTLAAATMVGLGLWQLSRYHYRSDINTRIDAATSHAPLPLAETLAAPAAGRVGAPPDSAATWNVVTATGRYDQAHEILARIRTLNDTVGFEIITPLVLADGTAVLVDRGWVPAPPAGASVAPAVPPAPTGEVTVVGRVHAPESRATTAEPFDGRLAVRRIGPEQLSASIPYPLYGAYLTLEQQTPPADSTLVPIPPDHENAAMNAGYVVQWWAFAALTLFGLCYLVYRQAHPASTKDADMDEALEALLHPKN
jgi:cytochrome oxidase assembly protein ShyY1